MIPMLSVNNFLPMEFEDKSFFLMYLLVNLRKKNLSFVSNVVLEISENSFEQDMLKYQPYLNEKGNASQGK